MTPRPPLRGGLFLCYNTLMKLKKILKTILNIVVAGVLFFLISNWMIVGVEKKKIAATPELVSLHADCIMILGAGVRNNSTPSPMLRDRLEEGLRLYKAGVASKILVSGDHGQENYDEVNVMKKYLMEAGVPDEDIFMDHAGFSTYESMYRARDVFGVKKMIIVTQEYHMYRALYIAERLGLNVLGSPSANIEYSGATYRNIREWLAREKDIFACMFKVKPKYLGEAIDIHGDGSVTND